MTVRRRVAMLSYINSLFLLSLLHNKFVCNRPTKKQVRSVMQYAAMYRIPLHGDI